MAVLHCPTIIVLGILILWSIQQKQEGCTNKHFSRAPIILAHKYSGTMVTFLLVNLGIPRNLMQMSVFWYVGHQVSVEKKRPKFNHANEYNRRIDDYHTA